MKYAIFFVVLLFITSCKQEKESPQNHPSIEAIQSTTSAQDVLENFKSAQGDQEKLKSILRDALKENFDANLDEKAVDILRNVLFHTDDETSIEELTPIFLHQAKGRESIENFYTALQSAYVTKYPQNEYSGKVEGIQTITTLIANKADLINNPNFNRFSVPDAKDYIEMSEAYALISPRDEEAGDQLVKAGNQAKGIPGYGAKAVSIYDWLIEKQPNHPKAAQALFLKAFTYDNELKQPEAAEKYYKEFIAKYPKDDFADDAQLLLDNIGKTDQEFYESIVKKKGEKK